ncbi:hypothetical protein [Pikeienuella sp. HZG-20]|uniref:hypothetical protein n=1 Tax=Paludibacillus litoralis TaxID=3133267 RepID=UPI0030EDF872
MSARADLSGLEPAEINALARDPRAPDADRAAARRALRAAAADRLAAARRAVEGAPAPEPEDAPEDAAPEPAPTVIRSTKFSEIAAEYEAMFHAARPRPAHRREIEAVVGRVLRGRAAYQAIEAEIGAPWAVVGVLHGLEAGFDFSRHLHNGDPLTARTRRVPAGRPATGTPPFTWEESAADALRGHGLHRIEDWTLARTLYEIERFNGFGYRYRRAPSPYLWSFSTQYTSGKYVKDGVYDPNAVSRQAGAATILKAMIAAGDAPALA